MKIAVPTKENKQIDAHFGHCAFYTIYTVSDDKKTVTSIVMPSPQGCGCKSNIAEVFQQEGISVMLAGGIGDGAINKLKAHGIEVVRNCSGNVDELLHSYLLGEIEDGGSNCAAHEHGHTCNHD
jgi:predicted Fe-Mo cluster-binding NifX family protein